MPDYIPRTDSEFDKWFVNFLEFIKGNSGVLGLAKPEVDELKSTHKIWESSLLEHHLAQASARKATEAKEKQRVYSTRVIRKYVRIIQARPATTNLQRRALGITLKPEETENDQNVPAASSGGGYLDVLGY